MSKKKQKKPRANQKHKAKTNKRIAEARYRSGTTRTALANRSMRDAVEASVKSRVLEPLAESLGIKL